VTVAIVVPCFDETARIDTKAFSELAAAVDRLVLVDDGSSDDTVELLRSIAAAAEPGPVTVVRLPTNRGKAEAVRAGLLEAIAGGASITGYFDADFATPVAELQRLVGVISADPERRAVLASRVALLGHSVHRKATRHYLGRLYATVASLALGVRVYDTQCGAKLFRVDATLTRALEAPFPEPWSFDVELLARLLHPGAGHDPVLAEHIVEVPLREWRDVGGSKLHAVSAARSVLALAGVRRRISAGRRR
jgi:glycosyltransferase involved in cell wall biosynthesis